MERKALRTLLKACWLSAVTVIAVAVLATSAQAIVPDSERLSRAKDYIADEQWSKAIGELRAALQDPKEPAQDEVLFWLAHSYHHVGDSASALETVRQLEQRFPRSRWVSPARSLRIEIAYRLRRDDLLWPFVAPPAPPAAPVATAPPAPPAPPAAPVAAAPPASPAPPAPPAPIAKPAPPAAPTPPVPPTPPVLLSEIDLRIQALSSLMQDHADRVIPILKDLVVELKDVDEARRALFVLAQSNRPEARSTVFEVARTGPEAIRVAAVRELGRVSGAEINQELLVVYSDGTPGVRRQVVRTLGQRGSADALMQIARDERDTELRESAVLMLGRAGGRAQLVRLYATARPDLKAPLITALFDAGADDELIQVAKQDPDEAVRRLAVDRLRLLDSAKARAFLATLK